MNRSEYAKNYGLSPLASRYPRIVLFFAYIVLAFFPIFWFVSEWANMVKDFKYVKDKDLKALKEYIKLDK